MTKTRRNLAVATALFAIGGSLLGATSAMAADHGDAPAAPAAHSAAQAPEPTVEVAAVSPDVSATAPESDTWIDTDPAPEDTEDASGDTWVEGVGAPEYLELLQTDKDVDDAQIQLVDFMKARGLQVTLAQNDEDGRPYAEYDTFVQANGDAVDAYWDMRLAQAKAQG